MNTIAIDTYKTIQKLKVKGFTQDQAEGVIEALTESAFLTKDDLQIAVRDLKIWVLGLLMAQFIAIVGTLGGLLAYLV